jgi:flagellar motor switch protein FliN/FliY
MFSSLISSSSSDATGGGAGADGSGAPANLPSSVPGSGNAAHGAGTGAGAGAAATPGATAGAGAAGTGGSGGGDAFALFRDVTCPVEVILGTGQISLRRCLALERGSVVRLQQSAGEDLQVIVNGIKIAHAEVVIIDETVGARITYFAGAIGREKRL